MGYLLIELITVIPLMIVVVYFIMKPLKVTRKFDPMNHFKDVIDERLTYIQNNVVTYQHDRQ